MAIDLDNLRAKLDEIKKDMEQVTSPALRDAVTRLCTVIHTVAFELENIQQTIEVWQEEDE